MNGTASAGLVFRLVSDGRTPVELPIGPGELPEAQRLRDRYDCEASVREGRRRVEIVPAGEVTR